MGENVFSRPVKELIQERHSWRDYSDASIEEEKLSALQKAFLAISPPFGHKPVFQMITFAGEIKRLLTYGFIQGAKLFIVGKITLCSSLRLERGQSLCLEDYGYAMEKIILLSTDLQLATCWVGGTFDRGEFATKIDLKENEIIPAISPIGYKKGKRSVRDRAIRWVAGSHQRKPAYLLFFQENFATPLLGNASVYTEALAMLRLAPSASNRQPWRVVQQKDSFHFYLQRTMGYKSLSQIDLQRIDMGIAMLHFELTLQEMNIHGKWEVLSTPPQSAPQNVEYIATWSRQ
jgi:nitroreductase